MHGRLVHNGTITVGTQTFLHTVCAAPIRDNCLLGLDYMIATGTILNLSQHTRTVDDEIIPISVNKHPGLESKKISNDQELIQSDPTSCPQNQNGNN